MEKGYLHLCVPRTENEQRAEDVQQESRECHQRYRDVAECEYRCFGAGNSRRIAGLQEINFYGMESDIDLLAIMESGKHKTDHREQNNVAGDPPVLLPESKTQEEHLRVHENPLEPAELAGSPARDVREEETS